MGVAAALSVRVSADTSEFQKGLSEVQAKTDKLSSGLSSGSAATTTLTTGLDAMNGKLGQTSKALSTHTSEELKAALATFGLTDSHAAFSARLGESRAKLDALTTGVDTNQSSVTSNMLAVGGWMLAIEAAGVAGRAWFGFVVDSIAEFDKQTGAMDENKAALKRLTDDWHVFQALVGGFATGGASGAEMINRLANAFERLTPALANAVANATGLKGLADFIALVDASSAWIFGEGPKQRASIQGGLIGTGSPVQMMDDQLKALTDGPKQFINALEKREKETEKAVAVAKRIAEAEQKAMDKLTGQDRLDEAATFLQRVAKAGGLGGLAPDQVLKGHKLLDDALEILAHRGDLASQSMVNLWAASLPRPEVIRGIQNLVDGMGKLKLGTDVGKPFLPIPPLPAGPGVIAGLGGLGMPGTDVGKPIAEGLVNPFWEAFGKLGKQLPDLIFGTLMAGGSIVGALASGLGSEFARIFQERLAAATKFGSSLSGSTTALGVAGMGISAGLGGFAMGQRFGKTKGALAGAGSGALAGAAFGSVVPGIGTALGAGIGAIAGGIGGWFGGRSKDKKDKAAMEEMRQQLLEQFGGMEKLKNLAKDLGVNIDLAFTTKKPMEFQAAVESLNTALEKQQATIKATGEIIEGVNARAANLTSQSDLDVVGAGAVAAFALSVQSGKSAIESFNLLTPAITAMKDAMAAGNFTLTESAQKLLGLGAIVDANQVQFTNLAASGQIVTAMLQGNIRDGALFAAVATDIGTQIQTVIDRGVPMAQVFALAQPQLQALWEAQQKWGFAVDDTTQALLTEAAAQGFVGAAMKSINAQILDVLLAIGKVLGADIPAALANLPGAAQSAAAGMQAAFDGVKGPSIQAPWTGDLPTSDPTPDDMHTMGAMMPMAAVPLSDAGGTTVILEMEGRNVAEVVVPYLPGEVQRLGLA